MNRLCISHRFCHVLLLGLALWASLAAADNIQLDPGQTTNFFGSSLTTLGAEIDFSRLGDSNGDGYTDYAFKGTTEPSLVIVLSPTDVVEDDEQSINTQATNYISFLGGEDTSTAFGETVLSHDFNNDGLLDYVITDPGYADVGIVMVVYGTTDTLHNIVLPEYLMGAETTWDPEQATIGKGGEGQSIVYFSGFGRYVLGSEVGAGFGSSIAVSDAFDGNSAVGNPYLFVGTPQLSGATGIAYVGGMSIFQPESLIEVITDGLLATGTISSDATAANCGYSVMNLGDLDGDLYDDIGFSCPFQQMLGGKSGAMFSGIYILHGSSTITTLTGWHAADHTLVSNYRHGFVFSSLEQEAVGSDESASGAFINPDYATRFPFLCGIHVGDSFNDLIVADYLPTGSSKGSVWIVDIQSALVAAQGVSYSIDLRMSFYSLAQIVGPHSESGFGSQVVMQNSGDAVLYISAPGAVDGVDNIIGKLYIFDDLYNMLAQRVLGEVVAAPIGDGKGIGVNLVHGSFLGTSASELFVSCTSCEVAGRIYIVDMGTQLIESPDEATIDRSNIDGPGGAITDVGITNDEGLGYAGGSDAIGEATNDEGLGYAGGSGSDDSYSTSSGETNSDGFFSVTYDIVSIRPNGINGTLPDAEGDTSLGNETGAASSSSFSSSSPVYYVGGEEPEESDIITDTNSGSSDLFVPGIINQNGGDGGMIVGDDIDTATDDTTSASQLQSFVDYVNDIIEFYENTVKVVPDTSSVEGDVLRVLGYNLNNTRRIHVNGIALTDWNVSDAVYKSSDVADGTLDVAAASRELLSDDDDILMQELFVQMPPRDLESGVDRIKVDLQLYIWREELGGSLNITLEDKFFYSRSTCLEPQFYALEDKCKPCPQGATCPGGNRIYALEHHWHGVLGDEKLMTPQACAVADGQFCLGTAHCGIDSEPLDCPVCADGYTGFRCETCEEDYYSELYACKPCGLTNSDRAELVARLVFAVCMFCGFMAAPSFLSGRRLLMLTEVLVFLQWIVVMGGQAAQGTSDSLSNFLSFLSVINMDVQMVKPGCTVPIVSIVTMFYITIVLVLISCVGMFSLLWLKNSKKFHDRDFTLPRIQVALVALLDVVFFRILISAMEGLHCSYDETTEVYRLVGESTTVCYQGEHLMAVPLMVISIILVAGAYPYALYRWASERSLIADENPFYVIAGDDMEGALLEIDQETGDEIPLKPKNPDTKALEHHFLYYYRKSRYFVRVLPYVMSFFIALQVNFAGQSSLVQTFVPCVLFGTETLVIVGLLPYNKKRFYFQKFGLNAIILIMELSFLGIVTFANGSSQGMIFLVIASLLFFFVFGGIFVINKLPKLLKKDNKVRSKKRKKVRQYRKQREFENQNSSSSSEFSSSEDDVTGDIFAQTERREVRKSVHNIKRAKQQAKSRKSILMDEVMRRRAASTKGGQGGKYKRAQSQSKTLQKTNSAPSSSRGSSVKANQRKLRQQKAKMAAQKAAKVRSILLQRQSTAAQNGDTVAAAAAEDNKQFIRAPSNRVSAWDTSDSPTLANDTLEVNTIPGMMSGMESSAADDSVVDIHEADDSDSSNNNASKVIVHDMSE